MRALAELKRTGDYSEMSEADFVAARKAVEDFGAAAKGIKVEVVGADHQNKPDVGSQVVRRWFDTQGVDMASGSLGQGLSPGIGMALGARLRGKDFRVVVVLGSVPALAMAVALVRAVPWDWRVTQRVGAPPGLRDTLRQNLGGLARLMGLIMSRATVVHCMLALLPFLFRERGAPATEGAAALTAMILSGAVGGMVGGHLSDRYGRRPVLFVSFALATPLFLAAIMSTGPATIPLLALGGGVLIGSSSLVTVEAQSLLPAHASTAAGLMMGVGMGIGGVLVGPVSALAQAFGIIPVLTVVSLLPLPGSILTLSLARDASPLR